MDEVKIQGSAYRHYTVNDFLDLARDRYPRADEQPRRLAGRTIVPVLIRHHFSITKLADLLASYYGVSFGFTRDSLGVYYLLFGIASKSSIAYVDFVKDDVSNAVIVLDEDTKLTYRVSL